MSGPGTPAPPGGDRDGDGAVVIRPLDGEAERAACVALQERVWGPAFADRVPASVLMIALETGGVASGAFEAGELVGFVFGITGLRAGRPTHWSDMLAVAPEHRGRGIGYRLKLHQRTLLLERGVKMVRWTFDPLEARNAHINLRRLGAVAREYRRDAYGASDSPLHAGIGTDRLVAEWPIASERVATRLAGGPGDPTDRPAEGGGAQRIAVPADIQALKRTDLAAALEWRRTVREALEGAFAAGYTAVDFERPGDMARYVLDRGFSL